MNRWLKGDDASIVEEKFERFAPQELEGASQDPRGSAQHDDPGIVHQGGEHRVAEIARGHQKLVAGREERSSRTALKEKVFAGWPSKVPELAAKPAGDKTHDGIRLRAWDFTSEEGVALRLWLMTAGNAKPTLVVLNALDEADWKEWCSDLGPEFAEVLQLSKPPKRDDAKFKQNRAVMEKQKWAFAAVCPRGIGPTKWARARQRWTTRRFAGASHSWDKRSTACASGTCVERFRL